MLLPGLTCAQYLAFWAEPGPPLFFVLSVVGVQREGRVLSPFKKSFLLALVIFFLGLVFLCARARYPPTGFKRFPSLANSAHQRARFICEVLAQRSIKAYIRMPGPTLGRGPERATRHGERFLREDEGPKESCRRL